MLSYQTMPGDIDHMIANDHAVAERQFQRLEQQAGDRRVLVDQIGFELALHATAEERVLYPAMRNAGMDDDVEQALAQHQEAKELLSILASTDPGETEFEQALNQLIVGIRQHAEDEEGIELPRFRSLVDEAEMGRLGAEFLAAKRHAPTRAHPNAPSGKTAHTLLDAGAALVDKVRDMNSDRGHRLATDGTGRLDPQAQDVLDAFASMAPEPPEILEPDAARRQPTLVNAVQQVLLDRGQSIDPEPIGAVQDLRIPGGAGGEMTLRVYTPMRAQSATPPIVMWIHGGGWVLFDIDTYDASCRGIANKSGAIVVSPDYRRAPEHPFPASHDDVLAAWRWTRQHAAELGGDPGRVAIGGESVGGNMAAATSLALKAAGEPLPTSQVLVYPLTTAEQWGESIRTEADARPLNLPLLSWMAMHAFTGAPGAASDPRIALLNLGPDQLQGLPPTLVITDERDPLRDQGEEFARHLHAAGVDVTATRYDGVMHEFFGAAAVIDKAEAAQLQAAEHLVRRFATV